MSPLRCIRLLLIVLAFGVSLPSAGGPAEDARAAFGRGDYATAFSIERVLAEQGDAGAQNNLGYSYMHGLGIAKDDVEAVRWFRKAAEKGNSNGQTNLGAMYQLGRGVAKDDGEAVKWFRKAAEKGNADGQTNLGIMYRDGLGVAKDDVEAVQWFRKAAEQGNAPAQTNLGVMYRRGRGVANDDAQAAKWFRKAAEQNFAMAQDNLGVMYRDGRGVTQDAVVAVDWFRKAAEQGDALAQTNLAYMYLQGLGVAKDDTEAMQWFRMAARQGHAAAQYNLGVMYRDGRGVSPHQASALLWFRQSAAQGDTRAQAVLSSIERQEREAADLTTTIAVLVRKYEAAQPVSPALDAERAALAREIVRTAGIRESLSLTLSPERVRERMAGQATNLKISPSLRDAIGLTVIASLRADRISESLERRLSETLDAATLRTGLEWERSDVGRAINRLELEAQGPELQAAKMEFVAQFIKSGGTASDARARACAQKDILDNSTEMALPIVEALFAAGGMAAGAQQGQPLDFDAIQRLVVGLRPILRDAARQGALAECLFSLRRLSDPDFDKWLEFLRTDSGGRYARGRNTALREVLLDFAEVFSRTLVDIARQMKVGGVS